MKQPEGDVVFVQSIGQSGDTFTFKSKFIKHFILTHQRMNGLLTLVAFIIW